MPIRHIVLAALAAAGLYAQGLTFEVASIKPAAPINPHELMMGRLRVGMKVDAAQVNIAYLSVADMIRIAYEVKPYQIVGPESMKGQRWDVVAKLPEGASTDQVPQMLQALLKERFKLAVHRETKEHAVYALVVGKNGPKLKPSEDAPKAEAAPAEAAPGRGSMTATVGADAKGMLISSDKLGTVRVVAAPGVGLRLEASKATSAALADMLSRMVDRPVVDMTGLKGTYQIAVNLTLEDMRNMAAAAGFVMPNAAPGSRMEQRMEAAGLDPEAGGSIFQNVQQLGLKLEGRKEPMEMLVVDHVEKEPTEN